MYHLKIDPFVWAQIPIMERRWYIEKFIDQKESENAEIESARRKNKAKR